MANKFSKLRTQFATQPISMLRSPAYQALSLSARRCLDRLQIELAQHGGRDNGSLPCTYNQFVEFGIHRHAIPSGLRELQALGFVEKTVQGRASAGEFRSPNKYRLTFRHTENDYPTDEWNLIKAFQEAKAIAKRARSQGSKQTRKPKQKAGDEI